MRKDEGLNEGNVSPCKTEEEGFGTEDGYLSDNGKSGEDTSDTIWATK